jgi:flagellar hook-associated protein 3 FlgL
MLYNTVSTLGMTLRLQTSLTELQIEKMRNGEEMSTGRHFDVAAALGAQTGRAISLRNIHDQTTNQLKTGALLDSRFEAMNAAMKNMLDAGTDVLAAASTGLGQPSSTGSSLQIRARGVLDQIVSQLNASGGNDYLFSGLEVRKPPMRHVDGDDSGLPSPMQIVRDAIAAATGGPAAPTDAAQTAAVVATLDQLFAVRDPATPPPAPLTDTFEGGFYVGTTAMAPGGAPNPRQTARPDGTADVSYGVQANDPYMRDLLQGLYMLAALDTSKLPEDAYPDYMKAAVDKVANGVTGLRNATARLGIQHANLKATNEYHKTSLSILNRQILDLESVDPAEASVRFNQLELQIEATAAATARISQMSLSRYL